MKIPFALLATFALVACTPAQIVIPKEGLQGGVNAGYVYREYKCKDVGDVCKEMTIAADLVRNYKNPNLTMKGDTGYIKFDAETASQGDASITQSAVDANAQLQQQQMLMFMNLIERGITIGEQLLGTGFIQLGRPR